MKFTDKIRRFIINSLALNDPKAWDSSLWQMAGSQSISGETVTEHTALTYSAVWNAVSLISGTISCLPLHLLRSDRRKTIKAEEQSLFRLLHSQANPYMTAQVFREVKAAHILLWGNAYAEIVRDGFGQVQALWPIPPNRVRPEMANGEMVYNINVGSETIILPRKQILHVPGLGFDGFMGYSVVGMARKSIGLGMAMETFGSNYFGKGTHPGGIITGGKTLKDPGSKRAAYDAVYMGLGNTHRLMFLEEGEDYKNIPISPEDSQFLESRQFQIPEIARWFNLPPHKLKDLTKSSFSNIESEQISFVTDSILPWLIRFEQNYDMQLLTESQKVQQKLYFRHNVDGLLRGNAKDRAEYYKSMFQNGFFTINMVLEKENMDPSDDPLADEHFVPLNMVPLSMFKEQFNKQNPPNPALDTKTADGGDNNATV